MLNELRIVQEICDIESFFIKSKRYRDLKQIEILKHNCFHLANLIAKISKVCEKEEHNIEISKEEIINEAIPDLIIYALQFANIFDVDLDKKYEERLKHVLNKYKDDKQTNCKIATKSF